MVGVSSTLALGQTTRPSILKELDRETRALYGDLQESVVRVALPPPAWVNEVAQDNPLDKWRGQLDPKVRQRLEEHVQMTRAGEFRQVNASVTTTTQPAPATVPAAVPSSSVVPQSQPSAGGSVTVIAPVRVNGQVQLQQVRITFSNHVGVIVDDDGHILVPLYVERDVVGQRHLQVMLGSGKVVGAKFVGSDRMMNLTVLQLDEPAGRPVRVAAGRPGNGSLVLMMSPEVPPVARLLVWTGGHQEMGLVADMNGGVWGFARLGHFLELDDCQPVVQQLVQFGEIKRAQLGVWVEEVPGQDALRQQVPTLGSRPALRILQVSPNSAAQQAGLQPHDLILSLAGKEVGDTTSFAIAISRSAGPTELRIIRDGTERTVRVDLKPQ